MSRKRFNFHGQIRPNQQFNQAPYPMMGYNGQIPNLMNLAVQQQQICSDLQQYFHQSIRPRFRGPTPMRNRALFNTPPTFYNRHPASLNSFPSAHGGRGKRRMEEETEESQRKKMKPDESSSHDDQYIVPCSKGTEQITVSIWESFLNSKMSNDDLEKKLNLQQALNNVVKDAFPGSHLFIVGSSMTGFATRTSDVDMCLLLSDTDINQKREAPSILNSLCYALRNCSFFTNAQVIKAKVPILKFTDRISGFECDININNSIGIRNTHLLRYYAHMDWRVRPLMLFVKKWARFHDINDASKKTISSYSLSLMLIHYLQHGVKTPVLPCLQKIKPKIFSQRHDVRKLSLEIEKIDFTSPNKSTLGELFLGFLDYYANVFAYDSEVISIKEGRTLTHDDVSYADSDWKFLCIEEPFEGTNTARSVYDQYVFLRIIRVFHSSFQALRSHRHIQSILDCPF